jgi:pSer/pThr/pTyr-binding forkhead associated (FHA) protein
MLREETAPVTPKRRWGTARFDVGTILIITPRDYDIPPVKIDLKQDRILGRAHKDYTPDIDLNPLDAYERGVSRQHALLRRQNDTVVVIDMNSANSTFLNGQRLMPDQPRIVRDGDEIRLGQLVLRINFEDAPL